MNSRGQSEYPPPPPRQPTHAILSLPRAPLPSAEQSLLRETGCGVVHCASSNFMLQSGVLNVRPLLARGINVALGTDLAGGTSPSMLDALRQVTHKQQSKTSDASYPLLLFLSLFHSFFFSRLRMPLLESLSLSLSLSRALFHCFFKNRLVSRPPSIICSALRAVYRTFVLPPTSAVCILFLSRHAGTTKTWLIKTNVCDARGGDPSGHGREPRRVVCGAGGRPRRAAHVRGSVSLGHHGRRQRARLARRVRQLCRRQAARRSGGACPCVYRAGQV